jgi:hypothetical protein
MSQTQILSGITGATLRNNLNGMYTELYSSTLKNALKYGFLPTASATVNTVALQACLYGGNCVVYINTGTYEVNDTIFIDSNTTIICEPGVILKKVASYTQVFMNRGALTKTYNENITIDGLEIMVNGFSPYSTLVIGLRAHMGFYYIKNLIIRNFTCKDGDTGIGMILLVRWENAFFDNIKITAEKDGINLGPGHDAIINNYICETYDDANGLKTIDYPTACVEIGDIYNVRYVNCVDRTPLGQVEAGYFCRAMTASWDDWTSGFTYQTGDLCLNAGHLYQNHNANSFSGVGTVAPVHHSGVVTGADGVTWRYRQDCTFYHTHIYNIIFDAIIKTKNRPLLSVECEDDTTYLRSPYPGTEGTSSAYNISITNCKVKYDPTLSIPFIYSHGNLKDLLMSNNTIDGAGSLFADINQALTPAFNSTVLLSWSGNIFKNMTAANAARFLYDRHNQEIVTLVTSGNIYENCDFITSLIDATLRMIGNDLPLINGHLASVTASVVGDICRDVNGLWCWNGATWNELSV